MPGVVWIPLGDNPRLRRLNLALAETLHPARWDGVSPLAGCRVLITAAADEFGMDPAVFTFLRNLRAAPALMRGSV